MSIINSNLLINKIENYIRSVINIEFYNYPKNKHVSPFDAVDADNYFAVAGKITRLGTFEEIGNIATPFDTRNNILTGDYVFNLRNM